MAAAPVPVPVLVIAHQSPPLGGPGVRRVASWMRAWPALGIEPALLTAPAEDGARFHGYALVPGSDAALDGRRVVRVPTPGLGGFAGWLARTAPPRVAWTLCPRALREPETPWGAPAIAAGLALAREVGARVIVSSSQPYEAHAVGRAVARRLRLPWVADFRDPMTEAEGRWWPSRLHWWAERREERRWFADADLVWATAEAAAARWRARFAAHAHHLRVRRNGVGALPPADAAPPPPPLRIGHVGRFTDTAAGSRLRRFDFRPGREAGTGSHPRTLFDGLARFLARRPEARGRVTWVTVGPHGPADLAAPAGVVVEAHGVRPNAEALSIAATCHALFLPLTVPPPSGSQFVQQKVYEYAALGRPVVVIGEANEATDVLGPLAARVPRGDAAAMADDVAAILATLWASGPRAPAPRPFPTQADVAAACAEDLLALAAGRPPPADHDRPGVPVATRA